MSGSPEQTSRITSALVKAIEAGASDWRMPWHHGGGGASRPVNVLTSRPYRGVNTLALWASAAAGGYTSSFWAGFRQWAALGGRVRGGERATGIVVWKPLPPEAHGEPTTARSPRRFARGYFVFNADQVDGASMPEPEQATGGPQEEQRIAGAELFFSNLAIRVRHGGVAAFYTPGRDEITMPELGLFRDLLAYYGVLFHEAVHATGAPGRCDRPLSRAFGSEDYALEELCAELGAALILADLGLAVEPRREHAAYLASWLRVLRREPGALFRTASAAQAAVDWMHSRQEAGIRPGPERG